MKQLPSRAEFENYVIVLGGFGEIYELHNMRVVDLSHDLNFFENILSLPRQNFKLVFLVQSKHQSHTRVKD